MIFCIAFSTFGIYLQLAGIKLNVVETTGPHHAEKLAANIDISTCLDGMYVGTMP